MHSPLSPDMCSPVLIHLEPLSKYFSHEDLRVTQRFTHDTLRKLPLSFKDITPLRATLRQPNGSLVTDNEPTEGLSEANNPKTLGGETVLAKYGKMVARGQGFLPVPFTVKFSSRVPCVEVNLVHFNNMKENEVYCPYHQS